MSLARHVSAKHSPFKMPPVWGVCFYKRKPTRSKKMDEQESDFEWPAKPEEYTAVAPEQIFCRRCKDCSDCECS